MPGADLLLTRVYDELMADVIDAKHIGHGVVDGVECEHLAFRNPDLDWQLWVEIGPQPIPRKYVITNKAVTGAPQYTLRIKEWRTDVQVAADAFSFRAPADARKVEFMALREIDEIPPGQPHRKRVEAGDDPTQSEVLQLDAAAMTGFVALFVNERWMSLTSSDSLVTTADARIGRPLTPMSYAGVARRTVRRGAYAAVPRRCGAAAGAYYGSGCYQTMDAYGRVYTQCP